MMSDRIATYDKQDFITTKSEEIRKTREEKEMQRYKGHAVQQLEIRIPATEGNLIESETDSTGHDSNDPEEEFRRSHKRAKKTGTTIFIPHDVLKSSLIVSAAVRNKISPTALSATLHSVIDACAGDSSKVNLHHSQAYRWV